MNIIVTVDENWAIGRGEGRLVRIPADWRTLQDMTAGGALVMGRRTFESLPQGQPLWGRENIVLTSNPKYEKRGVKTVHSESELQKALTAGKETAAEKAQPPGGKICAGNDTANVFVIGGESVYRLLLPQCDTVYVTMVEKAYEADRYFENLDKSADWVLAQESDEQTYFDITYYFRKYVRR